MSRKAHAKDKSTWNTPVVYAFAGDYGPFKPKSSIQPIENVLIVFKHTQHNGSGGEDDGRHPMYHYASQAQELLLRRDQQQPRQDFSDILIVDLCPMIGDGDNGEDNENEPRDGSNEEPNNESDVLTTLLDKEANEMELCKGFGKTIYRLIERLRFQNITLVGYEENCPLVLKLYMTFQRIHPEFCSSIYLLYPVLSPKFVNSHLINNPLLRQLQQQQQQQQQQRGGGHHSHQKNTNSKGKKGKNQYQQQQQAPTPFQLHVVFENELSRDKRIQMIRHVFPFGKTNIIPKETPLATLSLLLIDSIHSDEGHNGIVESSPPPAAAYDPEYYNTLGKTLFLSEVSVEMSPHTKQYERHVQEMTSELLVIKPKKGKNNASVNESAGVDVSNIDWTTCEKHIGGLVLRGNRCVLVRSLQKEWDGMRIPSAIPAINEIPEQTAIRSIVQYCEVDATEVTTLPYIPPINIYVVLGRVATAQTKASG